MNNLQIDFTEIEVLFKDVMTEAAKFQHCYAEAGKLVG